MVPAACLDGHHRCINAGLERGTDELVDNSVNQHVVTARLHGIYKRRGRDSNPRYVLPYTAFPVPHNRPLCHLSTNTEVRRVMEFELIFLWQKASVPRALANSGIRCMASRVRHSQHFGNKTARQLSLASSLSTLYGFLPGFLFDKRQDEWAIRGRDQASGEAGGFYDLGRE